MALLVDASVWIDFTRARSPQYLKQLIKPYILSIDARIAEPVIFEVLRHADDEEAERLRQQFSTVPILPTPATLWSDSADLGRRCRAHGVTAGSLDLLIAAIALYHDAELLTFDADFENIGHVSALRVTRLRRICTNLRDRRKLSA